MVKIKHGVINLHYPIASSKVPISLYVLNPYRGSLTILNKNSRGISLSYEMSQTNIHFLDLEISLNNTMDGLAFKTNFKSDQNG